MIRLGVYKSPMYHVNRILFSFKYSETWIIELIPGGFAEGAFQYDEPIHERMAEYGSGTYL